MTPKKVEPGDRLLAAPRPRQGKPLIEPNLRWEDFLKKHGLDDVQTDPTDTSITITAGSDVVTSSGTSSWVPGWEYQTTGSGFQVTAGDGDYGSGVGTSVHTSFHQTSWDDGGANNSLGKRPRDDEVQPEYQGSSYQTIYPGYRASYSAPDLGYYKRPALGDTSEHLGSGYSGGDDYDQGGSMYSPFPKYVSRQELDEEQNESTAHVKIEEGSDEWVYEGDVPKVEKHLERSKHGEEHPIYSFDFHLDEPLHQPTSDHTQLEPNHDEGMTEVRLSMHGMRLGRTSYEE